MGVKIAVKTALDVQSVFRGWNVNSFGWNDASCGSMLGNQGTGTDLIFRSDRAFVRCFLASESAGLSSPVVDVTNSSTASLPFPAALATLPASSSTSSSSHPMLLGSKTPAEGCGVLFGLNFGLT